MKPLKTPKNLTHDELTKAAPLAVSGALGAEFWAEVERRDAEQGSNKQNRLIEPRKTRNS